MMRTRGGHTDPASLLICPGCGAGRASAELFCEHCGLPLIPSAPPEQSAAQEGERRRQLRKIKPQLSEGALVRVAFARNQAEGEFIQGLLLEEGVPSLLRRSAGFDVPDFLAAGPRDVLVPASGADVARQTLLEAELLGPTPVRASVSPPRLLAGLLVALALGLLLVWLLLLLAGH
jgi:hypothetical protein